jgi:hypothetical protein
MAMLIGCLTPALAGAQTTPSVIKNADKLNLAHTSVSHRPVHHPVVVKTSPAQTIVQFGLSHMGKATMESGQSATCANFVAAALHNAHARSTEDYGVTGMNTNLNYIWGNLVVQHNAGGSTGDFSRVQVGDIIQFRNVNSTVKTTHPNGSWSTQSWSFPQHTAIVYQNLGGGRFTVLQQNSNGRQYVTEDTIDLSGMTSGTLWVYRPVAK